MINDITRKAEIFNGHCVQYLLSKSLHRKNGAQIFGKIQISKPKGTEPEWLKSNPVLFGFQV